MAAEKLARYSCAIFLVLSATAHCRADGSDDVLRLLSSNSDLVVLGEIEIVGRGIALEANSHTEWDCQIRILEVLKGKMMKPRTIRVQLDILKDNPFTPKKSDKRVFFLKKVGRIDDMEYASSDARFGVQPASIASDVRQLAIERTLRGVR